MTRFTGMLRAWLAILITSMFTSLALEANGQSFNNQNIAEELGYPADAKLLIIHADDLGVSHSENAASITAMEEGTVNSASIMVPCPWFPEIAAYARQHPDKDFGLHLTLTSEWTDYKWGPVTSTDKVPSLVNDKGYFYSTVDSLVMHADPEEVELEIRNQIEKAYRAGINVTHLDAHMYALRSTPELLDVHIKVGREYELPVLLTYEEDVVKEFVETEGLTEKDVVVDNLYMAMQEEYDNGITNYYVELLNNLEPGLSCLLVHTAHDNEEMKAVTRGHIYWGSAWRQMDFYFFTSDRAKQLLKENNIHLVTWREIRDKVVRAK
ncbi:polysaccharide deacetylase family protein [Aliifodinibius sp. S!AR15-10]|uniref:polysaccharide deacetylase family protein n=1 Tax=Aliifodinibius sp. S!AR15-10 TaxID=2950437 RepID=UPI002866D57A|nr:polysaccharide deacetylase family protein [Aliifodinibius sp. S!AR15-10]MDR8391369.1 polysaccharide deacetylase family protein [Aliifodinibius sp. S!AR15-10]